MCQERELVKIPGLHPWPGEAALKAGIEYAYNESGEGCYNMDKCIVPAVKALWAIGIMTIGACCGHGAGPGVISLDLGTGDYQGDIPHHCTKCGLLHVGN